MIPELRFDPDAVRQQIRAMLAEIDRSLPSGGQIMQTGVSKASLAWPLEQSLVAAENGLRDQLGKVLQVLNDHADAWKYVAQSFADVDGNVSLAVAALADDVATASAAGSAAGSGTDSATSSAAMHNNAPAVQPQQPPPAVAPQQPPAPPVKRSY
jgi:hypothetical protein